MRWAKIRLSLLIMAAIGGGLLALTKEQGRNWLGAYWPLAAVLIGLISFVLCSLVICLIGVLNGWPDWPKPSWRNNIFKTPVDFFAFAAVVGLVVQMVHVIVFAAVHASLNGLHLAVMGAPLGMLAAAWAAWHMRRSTAARVHQPRSTV